ncbi:alkaline phosphatase PafA [uncultured Psychroserpens sp.]|uniref:alkaline phosphatase PafA n=1 Tax=uncultured Psychroserpens sp. TaxID=255436 RepID=UPI00261812AB|nr:alkaline phosphatase PafA [uncultured Psychroserpens sp.]
MLKSIFSLLSLFFITTVSVSQNENPKLVVGIVVDQMRYDYLTRFYSKYSDGGFKRMINEGFNCKNHHFNYIPTKTGPGHASIFTGTSPKYHGIIGNDWFDKTLYRNVNCVEDNSVEPVGTSSKDGKKSPIHMIGSTFADENRLFTQMRGKTIGISVKHRGAILPAGHSANAAYWWDYDHGGNGDWMSSTFYMNELPDWVKEFNHSGVAESYFKTWDALYDINSYEESGTDANRYERILKGEKQSSFPHRLAELKNDNDGFHVVANSPYGNSITTDFTLKAIEHEQLGKDNITDVLTISYSSTDKVGHDFGPNSKEIEDTYLRLDLELERLFKALDSYVGKGEYTVFLTADHGAPHVPSYLKDNRIPSGLFDSTAMLKEINELLYTTYKVSDLALSRINNQVFIDHQKIEAHNLDLQEVKSVISRKLLTYELISNVYMTSEINLFPIPSGYQELLLFNGHNQKRSGDILFTFNPEVFKDTKWNQTGTDHHSGYNYDTHVPLLFFGKGIANGETVKRTRVIDIAPTISSLLGISFPNGATGQPLEFVID